MLSLKMLSLDGTRVTPCRATLMDLQRDSGLGTLQRDIGPGILFSQCPGLVLLQQQNSFVGGPGTLWGAPVSSSTTACAPWGGLHGEGCCEGQDPECPLRRKPCTSNKRQIGGGSQYATVFTPGNGAPSTCPQHRILWQKLVWRPRLRPGG